MRLTEHQLVDLVCNALKDGVLPPNDIITFAQDAIEVDDIVYNAEDATYELSPQLGTTICEGCERMKCDVWGYNEVLLCPECAGSTFGGE